MSTTGFVIKTSINSKNYFCSKLINKTNQPIENFLLCFSMLAPVKVVENCTIFNSIGGYIELTHPQVFILNPGDEWSFKYAYEKSRHKPMNNRWAPQGCFLKTHNGDTISLKVIDLDLKRISSVAPTPHIPEHKINYKSLRLVPHPYSWSPSAGVCNLSAPINVFFEDNQIVNSAYNSAMNLDNRLNLNFFPDTVNEDSDKATTSVKLKLKKCEVESSYRITITSDVVEILSLIHI